MSGDGGHAELSLDVHNPLAPDSLIDELMPSELKVLQLLTQGLSNQELAAALGVSVRTVTTHST